MYELYQVHERQLPYLWKASRQSSTFKTLGHMTAKAVGIINALEEKAVIFDALDAKRVVHTSHGCSENIVQLG